MFHIAGGVTMVPAPWRTWTRPFSCRIFTASRTTVRLTEKVSHSAGSGGSGVPDGWTPRTMRSTSSAVTALARLAGRRAQAGGAGRVSAGCRPDAVMSPPVAPAPAARRAGVEYTARPIDVIRHTSYVSGHRRPRPYARPPSGEVSSDEAASTVVGRPGRWALALARLRKRHGTGSSSGGSRAASSWSGTGSPVTRPRPPTWRRRRPTSPRSTPASTVEFVAQPFDQYYTLLGTAIQAGKGPDVMLFNGGGQIRDRVDALLPLDEYVAEDKQRLAGWDAFTKDGKTYAAPVTLQGHPIYYNKALYEKAGLDPAKPRPRRGTSSSATAPPSPKATGAKCFALGNKEGIGIQFFLSALGSGDPDARRSTTTGSPASATGPRRTSSGSSQLWKQANDAGLNNDGANSTAMFNDAFAVFQSGKAAQHHRADVRHRALEGLRRVPRRRQRRRHDGAGRHRRRRRRACRTTAASATAVAKWTKDPKLAADLVRSLTSTDALTAFYADAGAIASDTTIDVSGGGPAVEHDRRARSRPASRRCTWRCPPRRIDLMGRLSQQLLSGSITVDDAVKQLAASDQAG